MNVRTQLFRMVSLGWFVLGLCLLAQAIRDMGEPYWQVSWLIFSAGGAGLSVVCAVSLLSRSRIGTFGGVLAALVFACYWLYLYAISPPNDLNAYLLGGVAVLALSFVTISLLLIPWFRTKRTSTGSTA